MLCAAAAMITPAALILRVRVRALREDSARGMFDGAIFLMPLRAIRAAAPARQ